MTRWLVSVPVWGERYVDEFCAAALPALQRAVEALVARSGADVRLVVHTDQPERVQGATSISIEPRPVPAGLRDFDCMSQAHREVLALGMRGDVVVLLTAGAVISGQTLVYCAEVLENSRLHLVLCAVPRVLSQGQLPDTADASALMAWAWNHRHLMTQECTWPSGRSVDLSRMFFVKDDTVLTRQCLPHPLAVRIDGRVLRFTPTIDANLMQCFDKSEMHMTPDCQALAMIKLSPADKDFQRADKSFKQRLAGYALRVSDPLQRWCLGHRLVLVGAPRDCGDDAVVDRILSLGG